MLAFLPANACDDLIARLPLKRYTPRTIVKASALKMELMRVRSAGFATDDEELEEGLRCVGAPIFDHHARVIGSLSIAAPVFRLWQVYRQHAVRNFSRRSFHVYRPTQRDNSRKRPVIALGTEMRSDSVSRYPPFLFAAHAQFVFVSPILM